MVCNEGADRRMFAQLVVAAVLLLATNTVTFARVVGHERRIDPPICGDQCLDKCGSLSISVSLLSLFCVATGTTLHAAHGPTSPQESERHEQRAHSYQKK